MAAGDLVFTIAALKMEMGLRTELAAAIKGIHLHPGSQIEAKDLLPEFGSSTGQARENNIS